MKKQILTIAIIFSVFAALAQKITNSVTIKEGNVPKVVKEAHDNTIGFPAVEWVKITLGNGSRYVAVVKKMDPSSGKVLPYRYRYNEQGKITSTSQYRGNGKGEERDFFLDYLGSGNVDDKMQDRFAKLLAENTLVSFEGFDFIPANKADDKYITTHRLLLKDKKGKRIILYIDHDGNDIDMANYPIRRAEAEEKDLNGAIQ